LAFTTVLAHLAVLLVLAAARRLVLKAHLHDPFNAGGLRTARGWKGQPF